MKKIASSQPINAAASQASQWHLSNSFKDVLYTTTDWAAYIAGVGIVGWAEVAFVRSLNTAGLSFAGNVAGFVADASLGHLANVYHNLEWMPNEMKIGVVTVAAASLIVKGVSFAVHAGIQEWETAGWNAGSFLAKGAMKLASLPFMLPHWAGSAASSVTHFAVPKIVSTIESSVSNDNAGELISMGVGFMTGMAGLLYGMQNGGLMYACQGMAGGAMAGYYGIKGLAFIGDQNPTVLMPATMIGAMVLTSNMPKMTRVKVLALTAMGTYGATWAAQKLIGLVMDAPSENTSHHAEESTILSLDTEASNADVIYDHAL